MKPRPEGCSPFIWVDVDPLHTTLVRVAMETIPERGQSACLLKEEQLAVFYASGETLLNQAFSWPPQWNALLLEGIYSGDNMSSVIFSQFSQNVCSFSE